MHRTAVPVGRHESRMIQMLSRLMRSAAGKATRALAASLMLGLEVAQAQPVPPPPPPPPPMPLDIREGGPTVSNSNVGYIDNAIPGTLARLRYDSLYNNRRPTRAEFIWPGPQRRERSVDYQDFTAYLEAGLSERFSGFVEIPVRLLNPEVVANTVGLTDMNAGFKFAFVASPDLVATFQLRTYAPTGDADRDLGNDHVSLEPALLVYQRLNERVTLESEFRVWVPIGGTDFAGEILRYGFGLSYDLIETGNLRITPVVEVVGWTLLDGKAAAVAPSGFLTIEDATGDTIVNAKFGFRFKFGDAADIYAGYGRPLTGDRWYENTFRVELRLAY